ncbi:hypothetical protein [Ralstonia soli]|uniref:BON domain-containing protein n=1 Tax=Ralstonia soli TaxID=2953896 RepID=A0ABT1AKB0_9RALS|nr:hypothetical protein [Ralstonia soli]MCO5398864.1 hypothetical protein [Ralstonia soli]
MMATQHASHQSRHGAPSHNANGDPVARTLLSRSGIPILTDCALAVLARTATGWFAPSLAQRLCVSVAHGRVHLAGHIDDARPMAGLKTALLRLPGVAGLDQIITVDARRSPAAHVAPVRSRRFLPG